MLLNDKKFKICNFSYLTYCAFKYPVEDNIRFLLILLIQEVDTWKKDYELYDTMRQLVILRVTVLRRRQFVN